jgi:hypothetical protein
MLARIAEVGLFNAQYHLLQQIAEREVVNEILSSLILHRWASQRMVAIHTGG